MAYELWTNAGTRAGAAPSLSIAPITAVAIVVGAVTLSLTAEIFLEGLKAGLLTFGGAYTVVPFLQDSAVDSSAEKNRRGSGLRWVTRGGGHSGGVESEVVRSLLRATRAISPAVLFPRRNIARRAMTLALTVPLLVPASAAAHALFGDSDPNRPLGEYLWLGFLHMVAGWDHLLFILGVVLLAGTIRRAAKVISLFVLGHSLTLLVATIAEWKLDATAVDVVIALSLVYVGVQGLLGRPDDLRIFGSIVFAFGLVHGLGLSTRLQDLGLPDDGLVVRVLLFNVGVEVGQLVALALIVGIGTLVARQLDDAAEWRRVLYIALIAAGAIAAAVISFPAEDSTSVAKGCNEEETEVEPVVPGAAHPAKTFYAPSEQAPEADLSHVVGDGYFIVRYRPDLTAENVQAIEQLVTTGGQAVVAAPDPEQDEAVRAIQAERTLACDSLNTAAVTKFRDDWLARVGQ